MTTNTEHGWRAVPGLTGQQTADLEQFEAVHGTSPDNSAWLLSEAREHAAGNIRDQRFSHIPAPAGAVRVDHWEHDPEHGWRRSFEGRSWKVAGVDIGVEGHQDGDGRITAEVAVYGRDTTVTGGQARDLAAALAQAADELDRLTGDSPPFM